MNKCFKSVPVTASWRHSKEVRFSKGISYCVNLSSSWLSLSLCLSISLSLRQSFRLFPNKVEKWIFLYTSVVVIFHPTVYNTNLSIYLSILVFYGSFVFFFFHLVLFFIFLRRYQKYFRFLKPLLHRLLQVHIYILSRCYYKYYISVLWYHCIC